MLVFSFSSILLKARKPRHLWQGGEILIPIPKQIVYNSIIDKDNPTFNSTFSGKRIKRGLSQTKEGVKINADINGAANYFS